jgi:hypothetical protein
MDTMQRTQNKFPQGGNTPVFSEMSALLAIAPRRPDPNAAFEDLTGPKERLFMQNVIDQSGIVQPSIFVRSDTFSEPHSGLDTQVLGLAVCSGVGSSALLGGDVAVHVKSTSDLPGMTPADLPPGALQVLDMPLIGGRAITPKQHSLGKIQALSPESPFPARVTIQVYYTFVLGTRDGKLSNVSDNISVEGQEPHYMEAVVTSIPPDANTSLQGREWDLLTGGDNFLKLWIKMEYFRFLGTGDWQHAQRLTFRDGIVTTE